MSRLFGFFGSQPVNLSCEYISESTGRRDAVLKEKKYDGWGIGFFRNNASFLFKKAARASGDKRIANISEVISSHVFISQLRYAAIGERKEANTQPFRWGNWLFAHQGTIDHFRKVKPRILRKLPPAYKKMIRGNTDSEHCFYLFLTMLRSKGAIKKGSIPLMEAVEGLKKFGSIMSEFCEEAEIAEFPELNFLISNGEYLIVARHGNSMYFLEQEAAHAPETVFYSQETDLRYELQNIEPDMRFFIVASEKFSETSDYKEIPNNHIAYIDSSLSLQITPWVD